MCQAIKTFHAPIAQALHACVGVRKQTLQTIAGQPSGQHVGFACAFHDGRVWALFVDPAHEGHGHGRALHDVMIAWLRSAAVTDNADLQIVLVNHRSDMWSTTAAGGAPFFRAIWRESANNAGTPGKVDSSMPVEEAGGGGPEGPERNQRNAPPAIAPQVRATAMVRLLERGTGMARMKRIVRSA